MADYRTFTQWRASGRSVRRDERATHYLVDPDTGRGQAAFTEDQTERTPALSDTTKWELVPAETYRASQQPNKGLGTVQVELKDGTYSFWVGNTPKLIKLFKQGGYRWNPLRWRWESNPRVTFDPQQVIAHIEASPDYLLVREGELA